MTCESVVRTAVPADEEGIMELWRSVHAEKGVFTSNEDKVRRMIHRAWRKDDVIIGVIGPIGAPIAIAGLVFVDNWYSDDPMLHDWLVFVHPDHRKSNHARHLLHYCKRVAKELGTKGTFGVFGGKKKKEKFDGRLALYSRILGEPVGYYFLYDPAKDVG